MELWVPGLEPMLNLFQAKIMALVSSSANSAAASVPTFEHSIPALNLPVSPPVQELTVVGHRIVNDDHVTEPEAKKTKPNTNTTLLKFFGNPTRTVFTGGDTSIRDNNDRTRNCYSWLFIFLCMFERMWSSLGEYGRKSDPRKILLWKTAQEPSFRGSRTHIAQ